MTGRAERLLLALAIAFGAWLVGVPLFGGPEFAGPSITATDGTTVPDSCADANPGWSEVGVDLESSDPPIEPGRVFHLSDGTIAVLVVVTAANAEGQATSFDFSASVRVSAVIVRAGDGGAVVPFDPPARNGAGLAAPDRAGIDGVAFCYRIQVPNPPAPGATEVPEMTPTELAETAVPGATATATPGTFDVGAVQTANALATEAADARATAAAGEATREADAAAADATIAALATARADQDATAAAQATAAAETATAAAEERAALQATASAEVAAAQATSAALATADAARQSELATAQAAQTEAAATIAELRAATEVPSPTPTPAETRTYGVPDDEGFDAWAAILPPGWTVADGLLVADGGAFQGYVQPPRTVDRDDYAVEAEIRVVEEPACAANFGLLVRGSETGFYAGGVEWVCDAGASIRIWALNNVLAQDNRPVDQGWHTYRIAVNGDQITVSVDGVQVLQATDASFRTGGQIAIWSNGVKLEVRAFRVLVAS